MNSIKNLLGELWPDLLALVLYILDLVMPQLNGYLASHEHGTILGLMIAVLVAWHARHIHPGPLKPPTPPGKLQ